MELKRPRPQPESKLDIDNKVYIVYDENGKEYSRHPFQHVWDSSPAMRAADDDARKLRIALRAVEAERRAKEIEAKPLSRAEEEYIDVQRRWQKYFDVMFPPDKSPSILDAETAELYSEQMHIWMERMKRLSELVRTSVLIGTYGK